MDDNGASTPPIKDASVELFQDIVAPLMTVDQVKGARVAEIGSGTGRIVMMLLDAETDHVIAFEASDSFEVLRANIAKRGPEAQKRTTLLKCAGDEIPEVLNVDFILSIGVLHHIPNPDPVIKAANSRHCLKEGRY